MNKQKFIDLLRKPHTATKDSVAELESIIEQFPYFQSAHIVLAKGSKSVKHPKTANRISSAAVYSTDRGLLKKYINDNIIFLDITKEQDEARQVAIEVEEKESKKPQPKEPILDAKEVTPKPKTAPNKDLNKRVEKRPTKQSPEQTQPPKKEVQKEVPQGRNKIPPLNLDKSDFDADSIIDEMKIELEEYKKNKKNFDDWVQNDEERSAVEAALKKVSEAEKKEEEEEEEEVKQPQANAVPASPVETPSAEKPLVEEQAIEKQSTEQEEPIQKEEIEVVSTSEKEILPVAEVKPIEFKSAPIQKAKSSGYTGKILIEGSNKNIAQEKTEEEPTKKTGRTTKRVVKKVKKAPEPVAEKEEIKQEVSTEDTKKSEKKIVSEGTLKVNQSPEAESPNIDQAKLADKQESETPIETTKTDNEDVSPELEETNSVKEEANSTTEEAPTNVEEQVSSVEEQIPEDLKDESPKETEPTTELASSELMEDIPAPSEDDSIPDEENAFDLEVNEDKGIISREDDRFDIKKDKKRAGQLRKEKMRKLREQRGIIDEFIEADPQMPSPKQKKTPATEQEEQPATPVKEEPKDLAEESQKADDEMISENLAIIYKNQGKSGKAIEIYEKLILKFPKKEAYFAARIEELKKS